MEELEFTERIYNMISSGDKEMRTLGMTYLNNKQIKTYLIVEGKKMYLKKPYGDYRYHYTHYLNVYRNTIIYKVKYEGFFEE